MNADPTLLQMKFARIVTKLAVAAGIPAREALDFFYRSRLYPLLRDGVSDLHCMSDEYLVDELLEERADRSTKPAPYPDLDIPPLSVAEPDPPPYS